MIKEAEKKPKEFAEAVKKAARAGSLDALAKKARGDKDAVSAYAAAYLALEEGLGITPFDSQIIAGAYLDGENIVELATGEGKTAAAVFAAFYSVCKGERVHVLTFNDYLAKRDREWMKPAYDLLGVKTAHLAAGMELKERQEAYRADVLYSTVKECGFDFLRDFLVFSGDEAAALGYERAIVDEADSLLINEARIPLVAAGSMETAPDKDLPEIYEFVKTLSEGDFETDAATGEAYLTPEGAKKTERFYKLRNIYDEENNELLSKLNDLLKAEHVLTEDRDYIVKDGRICIIDAFTGRIAENRSYPGTLQAAVELKHGLHVTERGVIMGSIAIQFFIRQYKRVSGMTGTALSAKDEFDELYGLTVKKVEPNTPSIREDLPMALYYDEKSKYDAIVRETAEAHRSGRPVLVGTEDIEHSEMLSRLLDEKGIPHRVLNAKNDELEAGIIKEAGMPAAVTVSTNMAGRGVDIKLGGENEAKRREAVAAGGLYAIGTYLAESAAINDQLRGRAARQGDPGQSRLFVSLDEDIMRINKLKSLIPAHKYPRETDKEITDRTVLKEVARIQRISQGKKLDERVRLLKFTMIGEKHREAVFSARRRYLTGEARPKIWQESFPGLYKQAEEKYGADALEKKQTEYIAALMNVCWSRYLEYTAYLREGIHLSAIGGKNPSEEYNIACEEYYGTIGDMLTEEMGKGLAELLEKTPDGLKIPKPKTITTYLLEDTGDELERRTLAEALLGGGTEEAEALYDEYYGDESGYEDYGEEEYADEPADDEAADTEESSDETGDSSAQPDKPKKGLFSRLFGRK